MSTGGTFRILAANVGEQDKILTATSLLLKRLKELKRERLARLIALPSNAGKKLSDVAVDMSDWHPTLAEIEKTHIIHTRSVFKPFVAVGQEYIVSTVDAGAVNFNSTVEFNLPRYGEFLADTCVHIRMSSVTTTNAANQVKFADFPGVKLFDKVTLKIAGAEIASYTPQMANAFYENEVPVGKRDAYKRAVGQEVAYNGFVTPDPTADNYRLQQSVHVGLQTLKRTHAEFDMFIPLWFWFRDYRQAIPLGLIPNGQAKIEIKLAPRTSLLQMGLATASLLTGEALLTSDDGVTGISIKKMELVTNHLFMLPEVFDVFVSHFGYQLIRVHRVHEKTVTTPSGRIQLSNLVWPVESIYMAFHPIVNDEGHTADGVVVDPAMMWTNNNFVVRTAITVPVITAGPVIASNSLFYYAETCPVDNVSVEAQGVKLYQRMAAGFFTDYTPYAAGDTHNTARNANWMVLNFGLNPGSFQPNSHLNVSRSRELFVEFDCEQTQTTRNTGAGFAAPTLISGINSVKFQAIATCLNFIIIDNGSFTMLFST
jgi:hypothetical protein